LFQPSISKENGASLSSSVEDEELEEDEDFDDDG
jgi:hypothetical protein